jgi:transposase
MSPWIRGLSQSSQRDEKRYKLLMKVIAGEITLAQATPALGVSYRQAKRLKKKAMEDGLAGLAHGNRGRTPANRLDEDVRQKILQLSQDGFRDFNDTHFAEMLAKQGLEVSRESIRRIRREAGHEEE